MNRVLVIGEEPEGAMELAGRIGLAGFDSAASGSDLAVALRSAYAFKPDVIVLDATAGSASRELFEMLGQVSQTPTVVIGDTGAEDDLVWYLESGAVAYLPRPVSPMLLAARLSTLFRRTAQVEHSSVIRAGEVTIDLSRRQIQRNGTTISLTPTEFLLLQTLAEHAGRAVSQRLLLERVWGDDFAQCAHYLRLYIGYLRQKLEENPRKPRLLITEWGVGYRLIAERRPAPTPMPKPAPRAALA